MKLIIAGGRDFKDYELLNRKVSELLRNPFNPPLEIVSGGQVSTNAKGESWGADYLGERYAMEHNIPVKSFPADWDKYGISAGPFRNGQMAEYSTDCIVFWDGKSKGSRNMINHARRNKLNLTIINY